MSRTLSGPGGRGGRAPSRRSRCLDTSSSVDLDRKNGRDGFKDFERLDGCDPLSVETPIATTPSGGLHLYFLASKPYGNRSRAQRHGRRYAKPQAATSSCRLLGTAGMAQGPPDALSARSELARRRSKAGDAEQTYLHRLIILERRPQRHAPTSGNSCAKDCFIVRAVRLIMTAPQGAQEETRHRQAFFIGTLIAAGAVDYDVAYRALVAAANAMPAYGRPWRDLEEKVAASLARGMGQSP